MDSSEFPNGEMEAMAVMEMICDKIIIVLFHEDSPRTAKIHQVLIQGLFFKRILRFSVFTL